MPSLVATEVEEWLMLYWGKPASTVSCKCSSSPEKEERKTASPRVTPLGQSNLYVKLSSSGEAGASAARFSAAATPGLRATAQAQKMRTLRKLPPSRVNADSPNSRADVQAHRQGMPPGAPPWRFACTERAPRKHSHRETAKTPP